jgi:UDP-N-acetylmuramoyl-L-alanyl-D-glutamate--2,6-diaminopimelate ligase
MKFTALLAALPAEITVLQPPLADAEISAPVCEDQRLVQPGGVFVARAGAQVNSHRYIAEAIAAGAAAIVGEAPAESLGQLSVPYAQLSNAQAGLGYLAAAAEGYPSRRMTIIGVTGTDGKTTTSMLCYHLLKAMGLRVGLISTISAVIGDADIPTGLHVTTPSAPDVQAYLRRMADSGLTHCVLETTSHGLAQGRVNGVDYDIAVLTNLTHEHLDFHGSFANYRAAKGLLFEQAAKSAAKAGAVKGAVINADDANADYFAVLAGGEVLRYSLHHASANLYADSVQYRPDGMVFRLRLPLAGQPAEITIETKLVGAFNIANLMAAIGVASLLGATSDQVRAGVAGLSQVSGRMERIDEGQNFTAIVDFAHTPNALQRALETARTLTNGQVIAVFGSAGLRDVEKRRLMAEVGATLADICILTAEDPRTESLEGILQMMAEGALAKGGIEGRTFYRVPDRGAALALACALANPGDLLIACGKGHEQSLCFGQHEYPWDDRTALRGALRGNPVKSLPTMRAKGNWGG